MIERSAPTKNELSERENLAFNKIIKIHRKMYVIFYWDSLNDCKIIIKK